ncbi:MAG: dihydropteroate synthase [Frankiaceae bacterium]
MAPVREVPGLPSTGRCQVMGVVNVTPDSFSDGGVAWPEPADGIRHGLALLTAGADILDVGGESTRPGAERVDAAEEWRRIGPVVRELAGAGAVVSVDTMRAATAELAIGAGARLVNDVSGGLADPDIARVVAAAGVPYVVMHSRGPSSTMQQRALYADVVREVCAGLRARIDAVEAAGVDGERIIVDPGLGFAKDAGHNWALLAALPALLSLGRPVLIGASRKTFLGRLLATAPDEPRPLAERDDATAAVTALVAHAGAWAVRVHEVRGSADAVRVVAALRAAEAPGTGGCGA